MSVSVDVDVSVRCNGKGCKDRYLSENDDVYCESCAGFGEAGVDVDVLRKWKHDNELSLSTAQDQFVDDLIESIESGRPLALVRRGPVPS